MCFRGPWLLADLQGPAWAPHGPMMGPSLGPPWAHDGHTMGSSLGPPWAHDGPMMGPSLGPWAHDGDPNEPIRNLT